jgi:hypothetical protein
LIGGGGVVSVLELPPQCISYLAFFLQAHVNLRQPSAVAARRGADERSTRAATTSMACCLAALECPETFAQECRLVRPAFSPTRLTLPHSAQFAPLWWLSDVCFVCIQRQVLSSQRYQSSGQGIPMLLNITKIDRLVIELKIPPADSFFKLRRVIDEVNSSIRTCPSHSHFFSPLSWAMWCLPAPLTVFLSHFSLSLSSVFLLACCSVAFLHASRRYLGASKSEKTNHVHFDSKLCGHSCFNASSRTSQQRPPVCDASRSSVEFILEAMHNIFTRVLGEAAADVKHTMLKSKFF